LTSQGVHGTLVVNFWTAEVTGNAIWKMNYWH